MPARPFFLAGIALALALTGVAQARPDGWTRVTVLDVGQGDAILVEGSAGGRVLVDGGPDPDRLVALLDAHIPAWDRRLDIVVLTHPHEDHAAGMVGLISRYRIDHFFEPGMRGPGPATSPSPVFSTDKGSHACGWPRATASWSTTVVSASCGRTSAVCPRSLPTRAKESTTSRSCSS